MIRTALADDEVLARQKLRLLLRDVEDIDIVGECATAAEAIQLVTLSKPELLFLDIRMPDMDGFDVVDALSMNVNGSLPHIVFITAYDKYAVRAFEIHAIDYLLKPVGRERLSEAIERARRLTGREAIERIAQLQEIADPSTGPRTRRIVGKIGEEYFLLSADEIYAFQADGDLVWILTAKRKYLATQTLKVLEHRLVSSSFRRIHRNALVNVDHVRKMSALSSQRWLITLSNDQEFIASKRQARSVRQLLNW